MLTVYCVLWGDKYEPGYVYRLKAMVQRHLTVPFLFSCITDQKLDGINCVKPVCDWPGWWQKLSLFKVATGPSIYFDLDTVIVGSIDYLAETAKTARIAACKNFARSGHGGIQSSILAWDGSDKRPYDQFKPEDMQRLHGDQCFLTEIYGDDFTQLLGIYSYKYHCQGGLPKDAAAICFHGKPDYPEVTDSWVREFAYTPILTGHGSNNTHTA